ncbi:MAG: hypothetical protein Q7S40_17285 [Opitutaceae bacterium]|nr:hypothetical protein [Opitutaceae bacterium]
MVDRGRGTRAPDDAEESRGRNLAHSATGTPAALTVAAGLTRLARVNRALTAGRGILRKFGTAGIGTAAVSPAAGRWETGAPLAAAKRHSARILLVGLIMPAAAFAATDVSALQRHYAWPPSADHPDSNGGRYWDWRPDRASAADDTPLVDLRRLNEPVAGRGGWVHREGDKLYLGNGKPVRFWGVNSTGNAPLPELVELARALARRGVNLVRIHGGASKSLLDFRNGRLEAVNRAVIDQMHKAVVAARQAGIYTFVSNSFFIIEMKVRASYELEGYTQAWLDAHPQQQVPFGLVFLNDRLRRAFQGWLHEFVTAPNPYDNQRTPLAQDRSVAVIELLNEDNLFFFTFKPESWPEEQQVLAGRKFHAWLAEKHHAAPDGNADATVRRVVAGWDAPLPGDNLDARTVALANASQMGTAKSARRMAEQIEFLAHVQRDFHAEMTALLRQAGFGGLVSPSNWTTAHPPLLLDLEHETYRQGDLIDRHAYFSPAIAQEKLKHRIGVGDTFLGFSTLVHPSVSPTNVRQVAGYPSALSEFAWVNLNAAGVEAPLMTAAYLSLVDFDMPIWFALGTKLWSESLAKWTVGRPGVLGQFPGAALLFRRGDVAEAPVVVREGRTPGAIYRREPARIMPPRGFDSTRDDPALHRTRGEPGSGAIDPLAMMVGKVEVGFDRDEDEIAPRLAECIDRANTRVRSATGELMTNWGAGLMTINTPRSQGAAGFLRANGRIELRDVALESENGFGALLVIALDDRPLASSEEILVQVGAIDRPTGFTTEPVKLAWNGGDYVGHQIRSTGRMPWQVQRVQGRVTFNGMAARFISATALDEQLRAHALMTASTTGADVTVPLPEESMYLLVRLKPRRAE